jgi:hypothetical protein
LEAEICCTGQNQVIESKPPADLQFFVGRCKPGGIAYLYLTGVPPWTACVHFPDTYPIDVSHGSPTFQFSLSAAALGLLLYEQHKRLQLETPS